MTVDVLKATEVRQISKYGDVTVVKKQTNFTENTFYFHTKHY